MPYLKLIRPINILIIIVTQWLFKWMLIDVFFKNTALTSLEFALLVLATVLIAAAGNIINDIQDVSIDKINKPKKVIVGKKIAEKNAYRFYIVLNILGVAIGIFVANQSEKSAFAIIFVLIAMLLYYYSIFLKKIPIIGNMLVSLLVGLVVIITGVFTLLPITTDANRFLVNYVFKILFWYAGFAFFINFLRELIKDVEDVNGDYNGKVKSVPILLGKLRTVRLVSILSAIPALILLWAVYDFFYQYPYLNIYILFAIIGPLIYIVITAWQAKKKKDYKRLSILLKVIMMFGVCSIILIRYILFNKL